LQHARSNSARVEAEVARPAPPGRRQISVSLSTLTFYDRSP